MVHPVYASLGTSIFEEMSGAARAHGAINLGQGFPDDEGPLDVREVAARALLERSNQYPPMLGLSELRSAVADHYRRFQQLDIDPQDVLITAGATEALAAALLTTLQAGDECLLIQPAYDAYAPLVRRAGGTPRYVTLQPPTWRLTREALEAAVTPQTKAIVFNDPNNPTARAFGLEEIAILADFCIAHDLVAICDEVWEHVVFDGRSHTSLMREPGLWERTIKIGSAGKIFAMTGWKVGFLIAPPALFQPIARAHQYLTFTTPPALQIAVAYGLGKEDAFFSDAAAAYQRSRDRLTRVLTENGFSVLLSEATYFLCIDLARSGFPDNDMAVCRTMVREDKIAAIPLSSFYAEEANRGLIRLCFAKADATLDEAARRLIAARERLAGTASADRH
jgi:N-succinyldiaminopimelate aminotransferase